MWNHLHWLIHAQGQQWRSELMITQYCFCLKRYCALSARRQLKRCSLPIYLKAHWFWLKNQNQCAFKRACKHYKELKVPFASIITLTVWIITVMICLRRNLWISSKLSYVVLTNKFVDVWRVFKAGRGAVESMGGWWLISLWETSSALHYQSHSSTSECSASIPRLCHSNQYFLS